MSLHSLEPLRFADGLPTNPTVVQSVSGAWAQSAVLLNDGRVLVVWMPTESSSNSTIRLGYAPSLNALLTDDLSVVEDRVLAEFEQGSVGSLAGAGWSAAYVSRHPDGGLLLACCFPRADTQSFPSATFPAPTGGGDAAGIAGFHLYRSFDEGDTWSHTQVIHGNTPRGSTNSGMAGPIMYAPDESWLMVGWADTTDVSGGSSRATLWRSTDTGSSWSEVLSSLGNTRGLVQTFAKVSDRLYAMSNRHSVSPTTPYFYSDDSATSWTQYASDGTSISSVWTTAEIDGVVQHLAVRQASPAGPFTAPTTIAEPTINNAFERYASWSDFIGGWPMLMHRLPNHVLFTGGHRLVGLPLSSPEFVCGPISW